MMTTAAHTTDTRTEGQIGRGASPGSLALRYPVPQIVRDDVIDIDEAIRNRRVKLPVAFGAAR